MTAVTLARIEAYSYRVPIATPIKVAFGTFRDRPMVIVRVVDRDGAEGFGEVWCNWPAVGAEHRARLAVDIGERLIGRTFPSPAALYDDLSRGLETLAIQTGEVGPIAQVVAGLDIAVSDLAARKAGLPLYRWLGAGPVARVPVYATGINPDRPEDYALARRAEGHRSFKLKIGFGEELDLRNLRAMRDALGSEAAIMTDANQAFDPPTALRMARAIAPLGLGWFEEPMRVDAPPADWAALARASTTPLAGGENLRGTDLDAACRGDVLEVVQPDATKWGGVSGTIAVARAAVAAGKPYCPHVFGGGIATLVSLHPPRRGRGRRSARVRLLPERRARADRRRSAAGRGRSRAGPFRRGARRRARPRGSLPLPDVARRRPMTHARNRSGRRVGRTSAVASRRDVHGIVKKPG